MILMSSVGFSATTNGIDAVTPMGESVTRNDGKNVICQSELNKDAAKMAEKTLKENQAIGL